MILNIEIWEIATLKDEEGNWNFEKWDELKTEFYKTRLLPNLEEFNLITFDEVRRYNKIAWLCVNFLESVHAQSLKDTQCLIDIDFWSEKRWLYEMILSEISCCIKAIDGSVLSLYPRAKERTFTILQGVNFYVQDDLRTADYEEHIPTVIH